MSLSELSHIADIEPELASRGVAKLVAAGIITKTRLQTNKRLLVLSLTSAGRALYEQAQTKTRSYNVDLATCLSDQEAEALDALLKKLSERATELTQQEMAKGGTDDAVDQGM
jgi:DNA-binding MarR family transcriptional regulator